jgi:MATE family multidrug resistance protein
MTETLIETPVENFSFRFLRLTGINIISNILVPVAAIVDTAFLGHLSDIRYLTGVAIGSLIFMYLYRTCKFLRMATTGPTAQAVGASEADKVLLILVRNCLIAIVLGILFLLFQYPIRELGFWLLTAASNVEDAGREYFNTCIWGAPAVLCNLVLFGWFLGREQSAKVLAMTLISAASNIVLDYFFIIRWGWNSAGAGAATAISQYVTIVFSLIFIAQEGGFVQISKVAGEIFDWQALKATFKLNLDTYIRTFASVSTFAILGSLSGFLGTLVLASTSLLLEVVNLAVFFVEGSAFAIETLAGNFLGEGRKDKLIPLLQLSGIVNLLIGSALAAIFILFPQSMFGLFTNHSEVIHEVQHYLTWLFPILVVTSIVYLLEGYFLGLSEMFVLRNGIVSAFVIGFVPCALGAWWFQNPHLLWLGLSLFMITRAVVLGFYLPPTLKTEVAELIENQGT